MAQFKQWFEQDFTKPIEIRHCESVMFTGDDEGAIVGVRLYDDGTPYSSGGVVTGAVKRSDGGVVALTGTLSGNAASVVIPAAALAVAGPIGVRIILMQGGSTATVLKAIYTVDDNTGAAVDPGTIIPSVNDLITAINNAVASIPSDYSALLHTIAPDFSASTAYSAGDYAWYSGTLYRFTANHAAGSWTGTDATVAVIGNDCSAIKTALLQDESFRKSNPNVNAGVNCFDIERWLTEIGATHSYENDVHSFYVNARQATPYVFSETDIDVVFSCDMIIIDGSGQVFVFFDASGSEVGRWTPNDPPVYLHASKVGMTYGSRGNVTVSNLLLAAINTMSNERLTDSVNALGGVLVKETYGINLLSMKDYLDNSKMTYTQSGDAYTVNVTIKCKTPYWFSASDIPVILSGNIVNGTATNLKAKLIDSTRNVVGVLSRTNKYVKAVASGFILDYASAGSGTFSDFKVEADNSLSSSMEQTIRQETSNAMNVATPDGFSWTDAPVCGKIYTDGRGHFFLRNFDVSQYMNKDGKDYYVNPYGGLDSGAYDGLSIEKPFMSVSKAYSMPDVRTIYMMPGVYGRMESIYGCGIIDKNINFVGIGGDVICTNDWALGWEAEGSPNIVKKTTNIVPERIIDVLRKDSQGNYINFVQVDSVAAVYETADSWASVGGELFAHVSADNYQGWENIVCVRQNDGNISISGECSVYLENVIAIGGSTPIKAQASDSTHAPKVYAKNCEFWYGQGDASYRNAVTMRGTRLTIFQRCKAMYNSGTDGFSYHAYQNIVPKAIEIDCQGIGNGDDADGSDQGSTIHEGAAIIRVNGVYANNYGANIADQTGEEAVDPSESWNLGCVCFASKSSASAQNANFMAYDRTKMWLDGCVGYSSTGNLAGNLAEVKIRLPQFYGELKTPQATGDPTVY